MAKNVVDHQVSKHVNAVVAILCILVGMTEQIKKMDNTLRMECETGERKAEFLYDQFAQ
jgi:hypothetical protein